jgi:predicted kinase
VLVLDNTNTTRKGRQRWIAPAHARDFNITAVMFPVTLDAVQKRQHTRGDKVVPKNVVDDMYNRMQMPMIGDFADVVVVDSNLPK